MTWAAIGVTLSVLLLHHFEARAQSLSGRVVTVATGGQGKPTVARIDSEGTIHVLSDATDGPWYTKSTDGGTTFSTPMAVVDSRARQPGLEFTVFDAAISKGNRLHVAMATNAWKLKLPQGAWGFYYATIDPDGKAFAVRNLNQTPSEGFGLAADDKGMVTATWLKDKLYANVSRDNGKTFTPNAEINPQYNPCNCCTTSAAYGADGKLALLYREETNNQRDMYVVLWDQAKRKNSVQRVSATSWPIDACPMTYYSIVRSGDGYVAAWPTKGDVYFARLDKQGKVVSPGEIKTPGASGMRTGVIALAAADGTALVAWKKDDRLGWQLYSAEGQPIGPAGSAASPGSGAAGVVDKDGRFVLVR
jgi:hypothetical protein